MFANRIKKYGGTGAGGEGLTIELDGETQYLHTQNSVGHVGTSNWTVSMWVYYFTDQEPSTSEYKYIWQNRNAIASGSETTGIAIRPATEGLYLRRNSGWLEFVDATGDVLPEQWNNIIIIGNATSVLIYINNVYKGLQPDYSVAPSAYSVFGGTPFPDVNGGDCLAGYIDDIRIFNKTFNDQDVAELYNSRNQEIAVPPTYLQAFLDEGPADSVATGAGSIIDTSVAGNNLTPIDGPIYRLA